MHRSRSSQIKYRNPNAGVTMVELIVCFAMLAIFLTAATMCISHAILFFYHEKQEMAAFSVGDMVFSEIKDDIRTMQGSDFNGYIKLRTNDGTGLEAVSATADHTATGTTIEFVPSNVQDAPVAVQIDTEGCGEASKPNGLFKEAILINNEEVVRQATEIKNISKDNLTLRYYCRYPDSDLSDEYRNLYMDVIIPESAAAKEAAFSSYPGRKVVWHTLEKLSTESYQDFKVSLEFSVKPEGIEIETDDPDNPDQVLLVRYVDVTVNVLDSSDPTGDPVYTKVRRIDLANTVYYKEESTMYIDERPEFW